MPSDLSDGIQSDVLLIPRSSQRSEVLRLLAHAAECAIDGHAVRYFPRT
ncbi:MAG: hypothetical protein BMS9Abin28_1167 [Anaerolineae bacterium]|nr:MAG: hypothetical protein BMS9Abin28_1167 [Anaerolineae bacterium]